VGGITARCGSEKSYASWDGSLGDNSLYHPQNLRTSRRVERQKTGVKKKSERGKSGEKGTTRLVGVTGSLGGGGKGQKGTMADARADSHLPSNMAAQPSGLSHRIQRGHTLNVLKIKRGRTQKRIGITGGSLRRPHRTIRHQVLCLSFKLILTGLSYTTRIVRRT